MKAVAVFLLGACVGYLLLPRRREPEPSRVWTSADGSVSVAWAG